MEWISGIDRGFIFSLSLYTQRHTCTHTHTLSPCVCVLAVTAVTKLWFHPVRPLAFRPPCDPFQFQSAPRWIQTILETAECIELFCMASEAEKNQLIIKKKALWVFQTGFYKDWSIHTWRRCCLRSASLQCGSLVLLNCSIKNKMDESFQIFLLITVHISGAK